MTVANDVLDILGHKGQFWTKRAFYRTETRFLIFEKQSYCMIGALHKAFNGHPAVPPQSSMAEYKRQRDLLTQACMIVDGRDDIIAINDDPFTKFSKIREIISHWGLLDQKSKAA